MKYLLNYQTNKTRAYRFVKHTGEYKIYAVSKEQHLNEHFTKLNKLVRKYNQVL